MSEPAASSLLKMNQDYDELLAALSSIAGSMDALHEQAVQQYTPVVEGIVATRSRDVHYIEQTLDRLLDFACHPGGLTLFKSLCRHYFGIDPQAAADYVNIYRDMWDHPDDKAAKS